MSDLEPLSVAISKCRLIISLLGPNSFKLASNSVYADYYRAIIPLMRKHGVRRLFAMGTISIYQPDDGFSLFRTLLVSLVMRTVVSSAYQNILSIQKLFEDEQATRDIDWTVYRIARIPGESDAKSWAADRNDGEVYIGPIGHTGWTNVQKRGALARWLVGAAESGAPELVGQMPAVSRLAGSTVRES